MDAFQRGNFWSIVQNQPELPRSAWVALRQHVTLLPELTLNVPSGDGHIGSAIRTSVAEVDINYFDAQISTYMTQNSQINPTNFPIFETANTYLTEGGCCIGGYHSANGAQTYAHFTYITTLAISRRTFRLCRTKSASGWTIRSIRPSNTTPCGILEVGDPLEGGSNGHPYGTWPYQLHDITYHLQDETFIGYFGAPLSTSVNSWWTFQNFPFTQICQNGS